MEITGPYDSELEAELRHWLSRFRELSELYAGLAQLFANLNSQRLSGTVEDGASIIGAVHVGSETTVRAGAVIIGPAIVPDKVIVGSSVEISNIVARELAREPFWRSALSSVRERRLLADRYFRRSPLSYLLGSSSNKVFRLRSKAISP